MRLFRQGIKPLAKDALYSYTDFEKIKTAPMGRPKKAVTEKIVNKKRVKK